MEMKKSVILYVKSEKIPIVEYQEGIPGHPCSGGYRATKIEHNYKPEDQKAVTLLKDSGTSHEIIDLSDCSFIIQMKAKILGINETPTLIIGDEKIKGVENIRKALQKINV